jgi:hypothetical protein
VEKQNALVNILLVYLLLFVSGTWRYNLSNDKFLVIGFIVALLAWFVFSERKISERFLLYTIVFTAFLVALSIYTDGSLSLASAISSTLKIALAYLVIRTVGDRFVDTYVKVITFLAAFSLFGYVSDTFNLFDGLVRKLPKVANIGYEGFLYLYRFPWHIDRNNSIFYEPGAYQAFLNAALFLLFFAPTSFSPKTRWVYIFILVVTLITTFSTTGFLIFLILLTTLLYRSELLTFSGKLKLIGVGIIVVSAFATQFYSTVVVKVGDYLTANENEFTFSAQTRSSHAKTDLKLFKKHVFGLGNDNYTREFGVAGNIDPVETGTSSNGVTKMLAVYGLPFSLFIFGSYYWALKKMLHEFLLTTLAFCMFMMFLAGESYYMSSPISFAIIASAFVYRPGLQNPENQSNSWPSQ